MVVLTVGGVARLAGVTVRTLHHYDEIGLVVPGSRTRAGYRIYGTEEIERLQEVLFFRELGFGLDDIKRIIGQPGYNRAEALHRQRQMLESQADHLSALIDSVEQALQAERTGINMSNEDALGVFGDFDPAEYEEEAKQRWGEIEAYQQSAQRTARYTKQDWEQIRDESDVINRRFLALMADGVPTDTVAAMDVAEEHRSHITKWFYDCSRQAHAGLGQMYVADPRFTENIDKTGEGLAAYVAAAIAANALR
jgi:DNA-binding transcriptional MerR regulator